MTVLDEIKERIAYQLSYWEDEPSAIHMRLSAGIVSGDGKVEERAEVPLITCKDCATEIVYPDGYVDHECELIGTWADSEWNPDGFCAWAKRREKC